MLLKFKSKTTLEAWSLYQPYQVTDYSIDLKTNLDLYTALLNFYVQVTSFSLRKKTKNYSRILYHVCLFFPPELITSHTHTHKKKNENSTANGVPSPPPCPRLVRQDLLILLSRVIIIGAADQTSGFLDTGFFPTVSKKKQTKRLKQKGETERGRVWFCWLDLYSIHLEPSHDLYF